MAELSDLKKELLSMKCYLCKNFLSVPPIILLNKYGNVMKCGRCKNVKETSNYGRNLALENMSKYFSFTCIYKDCNKIIPWKHVENHEDACDKRTIICPLSTECDSIIEVKYLKEHMEQKHKKNIHYNALIDVTCFSDTYVGIGHLDPSVPKINVVISNEQQFLVMSRLIRGNEIFEIYVATFSKINESCTFDLKLSKSDGDSYSILMTDQPVSKYDAINDCFRCMVKLCKLANHPHSTANGKGNYINLKCKQISVSNLQSSNFNNVRYTVTFHPRKGSSADNIESGSNDSKYADLLRKQLQCPICFEYMIGSIFNCQNGHVVCKTCKSHLANCPSCRANLGTSRCYPLESLADETVLPCQFAKSGCDFVGKVELLSQHEKSCRYS